MKRTFLLIVRDAAIAAGIFAVVGVTVNAVRADGLPFIADKPYDIFVPCPETLGEVEMIAADDARIRDGGAYIVDARTAEEFAEWHFEDADNITYDYLEPIDPAELKNIIYNIANSGMARIVVYGDGDGGEGTSGYQLGRELAGNGMKNVFVVKGGADALRGGKP